ncbi:MAG: hypothetical protein F9K30_08290 [Dechloromonas sp.]|nr:MAG: hypothetical protein F9K30_08290 [Dechloromonas sp.]
MISNGSTAGSLLIGLKKAAEMGNVSVDAICMAAEQGEVELLFEVPQGQTVVLKQAPYVDAWTDTATGFVDAELTPEYLVLRARDCVRVIHDPFVECSEADCGYRRNAYAPSGKATHLQKLCAFDLPISPSFPIRVEVDENSKSTKTEKRWTRWMLWSGRQAVSTRVRADDLYLRVDTFFSWKKWDTDDQPNSEYFLGKSTPLNDIDDDFKSPQLLRMCEAAFKFWGAVDVLPSEPSSHPSNQVVVTWLLRSGAGFTKTSAENAAALIKPSFGLRAGAPEKKK